MNANKTNTAITAASNSSKPSILDKVSFNKALKLAKKKYKDGQFEEAKRIYEDILQKFSKHKIALSQLKLLTRGPVIAPQDPSANQLQPIINLYTQGQLQQALSAANKMLEEFPNSVMLYNISGVCNGG
jgi:outer membrane protein assembly factor BamD (BamD/ComL family)